MPTPVIPMAALSEGESVVVKVHGTEVLLCMVNGQYHAVAAHCTHARQSLAHGRLREYEIVCPLHGARFDVRSGVCTRAPAQQALQVFPVTLEGGKVCVEVR